MKNATQLIQNYKVNIWSYFLHSLQSPLDVHTTLVVHFGTTEAVNSGNQQRVLVTRTRLLGRHDDTLNTQNTSTIN